MASGCSCQMQLAAGDTGEARDAVRSVLDEVGFRTSARGRTKDGFRVSGIRGNKLTAILLGSLPFADLLGIGARVGAQVKCARSLDKGDDRLLLYLRVYPVQEFTDNPENFVSSDLFEAIGDHRKCKRIYGEIVERLTARGVVVPFA